MLGSDDCAGADGVPALGGEPGPAPLLTEPASSSLGATSLSVFSTHVTCHCRLLCDFHPPTPLDFHAGV